MAPRTPAGYRAVLNCITDCWRAVLKKRHNKRTQCTRLGQTPRSRWEGSRANLCEARTFNTGQLASVAARAPRRVALWREWRLGGACDGLHLAQPADRVLRHQPPVGRRARHALERAHACGELLAGRLGVPRGRCKVAGHAQEGLACIFARIPANASYLEAGVAHDDVRRLPIDTICSGQRSKASDRVVR